MTTESIEPASIFTATEWELGVRVLNLVLHWSGWVHRRVETVYFESADTYRRKVSVDFTLPDNLASAASAGDGQAIHFTPLALLKKRPLTNFDLHDESGTALPLLTKQRNGLLSAGLLCALASAVASEELTEAHGEKPPVDIERTFLKLALSPGDDPSAAQRELEPSGDVSASSAAWRAELLEQGRFLAIANTFTLNYLVVVPLRGPPNTRRILKLAYDEPPVAAGNYTADKFPRRVGRRILGTVAGETVNRRPRATRRPGRLRRGLGIRSDVRVIDVPSVSYGSSYHLEFVAPDGLTVTRGDLLSLQPGEPNQQTSSGTLRESRRRAQLYLSADTLPAAESTPLGLVRGYGFVHLRPLPGTLIRATFLLSLFTTALLTFVALRWQSLADDSGAVPSLLLIVPAGLAAFITRSGEDSTTTSLLFGIRIAAILTALCAYVAAATLVGGRSCRTGLFVRTCGAWSATPLLLWALVACALLITLLLAFAWLFTSRPPEQTQAGL
jgi:hypothetical protein